MPTTRPDRLPAVYTPGSLCSPSAEAQADGTGATGSFTGTVSGGALLARNPDGSYSFTLLRPSHEVDKLTENGTLSF